MKLDRTRLNKTLVIYGRNAVHEALLSDSVTIDKIHLADSNRPAAVIKAIEEISDERKITVEYKSKKELSYISRNSRQDQGVAADIFLPGLVPFDQFEQYNLEVSKADNPRYILLNGVTNPQNLGMIIRNVAASGIAGLILPTSGCADLGPLAIKASTGSVFNCPILRCSSAHSAAEQLQALGALLIGLDSHAELVLDTFMKTIAETSREQPLIFILGGESDGLDREMGHLLDSRVRIPMQNGVESLNVAVTAALVAFYQSQT